MECGPNEGLEFSHDRKRVMAQEYGPNLDDFRSLAGQLGEVVTGGLQVDHQVVFWGRQVVSVHLPNIEGTMKSRPGQIPGQVTGEKDAPVSPGYSWSEYLESLIQQEGTLAAVAQKLALHSPKAEDMSSIERALRRLRAKGQRDGGAWGQRVVRLFGIPSAVEERIRWMGLYHSPFSDLPVKLCLDLLRVWDRPPVISSRARVYLLLGFSGCGLRERRFDDAERYLNQAESALSGREASFAAAKIELFLCRAYLESRRASGRVEGLLLEASELLRASQLSPEDASCFHARLTDQWAYQENRSRTPGSHAQALLRYEALPKADVHPFASYRRESGLAYGHFIAGDRTAALSHAREAIRYAGDGGYVRLRAMGLLMEARILGAEGAKSIERARAIAERLGDMELLARIARAT